MELSRCAWFLRILFAVIAALQGNHLLDSAAAVAIARTTDYDQRFPDQAYFSNSWRNGRHAGSMVARGLSKVPAQRSRSADDQLQRAANRQQLQQTSTRAEVQVLMAFKEGVTLDSLGALNSWSSNDSDACQWMGVTCTQRSRSVVALQLGSLQLAGTISPLLGRLTNLQALDLSDNSFIGEIPSSLFNCSHLSYLALSNNNLTGQIPSQVGSLLHLQHLDLGYNLLAGPIPASLSNCSLLELIHLHYTSLSGDIPSSLGRLAHLGSLTLFNTFITGIIPNSLGNCSDLTVLSMGNLYDLNETSSNANNPDKELSGELPTDLGNLKRLQVLEIAGTSIRGTFPAWIENLTVLTTLSLPFNSFSGEIPAFLGKLPLEQLSLGGPGFWGLIPAAISNCSNLYFLGIDKNVNVSGPIPPELGMLSKLESLYFTGDSLTGTIPSSLSNCSALRVLSLGENPLLDRQPVPSWIASMRNCTTLYLADMNLDGEIPKALGDLARLDYLSLWGNRLSGGIPASLGNCSSLFFLELANNQLIGELPPEIWMLSQLQIFYIHDNLLTGTLAASMGNMSLLQSLDCHNNYFTGAIPSRLGSLQSLQQSDFGINGFDGYIPQSLGNCSALQFLYVDANQLSGSIPGSLGNLTALEELYLSENELEGEIPIDLMRCTALGSLHMYQNLLVGGIPQEIGQLVSLQSLYLNDNKLSGGLPTSFGLLTGLLYLDVSYNAFDGALPGEAIANMSSVLNSLNVSHNKLSGSLPPELQKLKLAVYLDFSVNNFSGSIPPGLGDCKSLESLDLSINNFSGAIPAALAQLQYLAFVNVSYNDLQGPVPHGGVFNSSNLTAASFLGNPGLCGSMLKGCPVGPSPASPSSCKVFRCGNVRTAIIVAFAGAGIVLILIAAVVLICWLFFDDGKNDAHAVVTFATGHGLKVSEQELVSIIERPENVIGVGGTCTVYKGVLNGGRTVAVKVMSLVNDSDDHEHNQRAAAQFYKEARTLSQLRHRNILKVLGLFSTQDIKALILEFMPKASLHQQLYQVEECHLTWEERLNIALGVAQGMVYLHSQAHAPVIHRDLKPSNIFLDADLEPKLGDFGISRLVNPDGSGDGEVTASKFCGTFGYIPPEYGGTDRVSTKGDVYSYGVILLELLTRKGPIVTVADSEESDLGLRGQQSKHLVDWVLESSEETALAVLDPMLLIGERISTNSRGADNNSGEQMKLMLRVGLLCTQNDPQSRPQMSDVLAMLMQIKERGSDPAHRPTVAELADKITNWPIPGVNPAADSVPADQFSN